MALEKVMPRAGFESPTSWSKVMYSTTTLSLQWHIESFLASCIEEGVLISSGPSQRGFYTGPMRTRIPEHKSIGILSLESTIGFSSVSDGFSMEPLLDVKLPQVEVLGTVGHMAVGYYFQAFSPFNWFWLLSQILKRHALCQNGLKHFITSLKDFLFMDLVVSNTRMLFSSAWISS